MTPWPKPCLGVGLTPEILREARLRARLSYREFGLVVGYSGQYLCNLETGKRRITPAFRRQFMAVMEVLCWDPAVDESGRVMAQDGKLDVG